MYLPTAIVVVLASFRLLECGSAGSSGVGQGGGTPKGYNNPHSTPRRPSNGDVNNAFAYGIDIYTCNPSESAWPLGINISTAPDYWTCVTSREPILNYDTTYA